MATLLYIITEGVQGGPFELSEGTHVVGSAEGSGVLLSDMTVSAQHGQFTVSQGQVAYQDLGSQNGSFVGDQPITEPVALTSGHILQVGNIHLQLVEEELELSKLHLKKNVKLIYLESNQFYVEV